MADGGLIDKLLGAEELEAPEATEAIPGIVTADTVATIVAMDAARFDPNLSQKAADYLDRQRDLTILAIKHFDLERHLAIEQSRLSIRAAKRKAISDRLRIALQVVIAFIPLFLIAGIIFLIYGAVNSHSVVVDVFQAPAALAPSGVTGQVVATGILDDLQKLQVATRSIAGSKLATRSAWSSDVKIEVPETGVSLGEIDRLLRLHLGHDIHISGDLTQAPSGGLALTVRGDDVLPRTFEATAADIVKLTSQASEYIYGQSQPYPYLIYLLNTHRDLESLDFVSGAFQRSHDDVLRSRLANGWGNALADLNRSAEALQKYRLAILLQPYYWTPRANAIVDLAATAGEEIAWRESQSMLLAARTAPQKDRPPTYLLGNAGTLAWDLQISLAAYLENTSQNNGAGANVTTIQAQLATIYTLMHDAPSASRYMALSDPNAPETLFGLHVNAILEAADRNDPASAVVDADALWKLWLANPQLQAGDDSPCLVALVLGMAGRTVEADAIFHRLGPWSRCTAAHGQILEHQGNLPAAEAAWADGIGHTPDLPFDYMARGLSEENRGDLKSSEADFAKACTNAPHFADPFKDYGDLLAREGRWKDALAKYDEGIKSAPNWPALHQARDIAARKL